MAHVELVAIFAASDAFSVGETVRFDSRVCGNPTPEVTWFKDDKELIKGDKYDIKVDGQIHTLFIKDCMPEDRGIYTCQAKNKNGTVRYHPELMVRGGKGAPFFMHISAQTRGHDEFPSSTSFLFCFFKFSKLISPPPPSFPDGSHR